MRLMCELPFHCLARSCHLEVLMVISIDSLLIKQLRKLLNVILVISNSWWQDIWRDNSILENMSSWHLLPIRNWSISQHYPHVVRHFIVYIFFNYGGHKSFLWGHWYPCFALWWHLHWVSKPRVGSLIHTWERHMSYTFPEIHLWCDTCWPPGSQYSRWPVLFHVPESKH